MAISSAPALKGGPLGAASLPFSPPPVSAGPTVQPHTESPAASTALKSRLKMSFKQRLGFYEQLSTLVESGVNLIDALILIRAQERNAIFKVFYKDMIHHINTGLSLADSMAHFPRSFPSMQVALIEAAEKSGNLREVLSEMVREMQAGEEFFRKIKGAMFYPLILLVLAGLLVVGMMTFVIPKIAQMYAEAQVRLPAITQGVITVSDFIVARWVLLFPSLALVFSALWFFFGRVRVGRLMWERLLLSLPVIKTLQREKILITISGNMAMLLKSGVLISQAFEITEKTVDHLHYQKALHEIRQGVLLGKEISHMMGLDDLMGDQFREHPLFPLYVAQMVHIGESTGTISRMLQRVRETYHKSMDYRLKTLSTIIEPLMIFFVALLVGSILLAVMLPFFYIGSTIN